MSAWGQLPSNSDHEPSASSRCRYGRRRSPPFGEDVPVPGARATLLLLGQRQKLEAGEKRGKAGQVAIVVWVRLGIAAADESVRGHRPAVAELPIAFGQHRTLVEPAGLQDAPDLGETAADIAH